MSMWSKAGAFVLAVGLAVAAGGCGALVPAYSYHGSVIDPPVSAPDFLLTSHAGEPFRLSDQAGQVVLFFFGYTSCPDVCPATLAQFRQVRAQLGRQADQVRFVLITVDPDRDTQARLKEYVTGFDPAFVGLTGSLPVLEAIWQSYGVYRGISALEAPAADAADHAHAEEGYEVDHTARIYAVDARGRLRLTYTLDVTTDDLTRDVQQLVREGS